MTPTGTLQDDGRTLVLHRTFRAPAEDVWASITESERLGRWFGTWSGDPADGFVEVTMNAEAEPVPPSRFDIVACEPPHRLCVVAVDDQARWQLTADITEAGGTTTLVLRQHDVDPAAVGDTAPGWEWYLDRLVAVATGGTPPSLEAFETDYLPLGAAYVAMLPATSPPTPTDRRR
jgi:uncharacterized protein YndB with AHSA1/START domain